MPEQIAEKTDVIIDIPVVDHPFETPEEIRTKYMQNAIRRDFSELVKSINIALKTSNANKWSGHLEYNERTKDIVFKFDPKKVTSTGHPRDGINFHLEVAPSGFSDYVRENIRSTNDFFDHLSTEKRMGGNNTNVINTRAAWMTMFQQKFHAIGLEEQLPRQIVVMSDNIDGQRNICREHIEGLVDQDPDLYDLRILKGVPYRRSLHIPFTNVHGNPDTMMLGEPHPPKKDIQIALADAMSGDRERKYNRVFSPYMVGQGDIRHDQLVLIPSSAFADEMEPAIRQGEFFGGNDEEFEQAVGIEIPEVISDDGNIHTHSINECNTVIRQYWSPTKSKELRQLTEIGIRTGGTLGVYSRDGDMYGIQTVRVQGEHEDELFRDISLSTVGANAEGANTTGGGDSKLGTQTMCAQVLPAYLEAYLKQEQIKATTGQKTFMIMAITEVLASMTAHIVRNSTQSSLWNIPTEDLERLFDKVTQQVVEEVVKNGNGGQSYIRAPYGADVYVWRIPKE